MTTSEATPESTPGKQSKGVIAVIALACICSLLALTFTWVRNQTLNTDRYVATVAPLAQNKAIQGAVTGALTAEFVKEVDPQKLAEEKLPSSAAPLAGPIAQAITGFVRTIIGKVVESKQFATLWKEISRESHAQVVAILTGKRPALDKLAAKGKVTLNLEPVVGPSRAFLSKEGISGTPLDASPSLVVFDLSSLETAQGAVKTLKGFTLIFTILAPLLFIVAVLMSRNRRRTIITSGLSLAGTMVILGLILLLGREFYLEGLPSNVPRDAAAAFFDTIVRFFATGIRITALVGLVAALSAWWSGPGRKAASDLGGEGTAPVARVVIIGVGATVLLTVHGLGIAGILAVVAITVALALAVGPAVSKMRSGPAT
jgi:hypothetical protein